MKAPNVQFRKVTVGSQISFSSPSLSFFFTIKHTASPFFTGMIRSCVTGCATFTSFVSNWEVIISLLLDCSH